MIRKFAILAVLVAAIFSASGFMESRAQDDQFRRPENVKKVTTQLYRQYRDEEHLMRVMVEEFNEKGDCTSWYLKDSLREGTVTYENKYDDQHRLTERSVILSDHGLREKKSIKYHDKIRGRRTEITESQFVEVNGKLVAGLIVTAEFNEKGKIVKETLEGDVANGKGQRDYKYDERGHLTEIVQVYDGNTTKVHYKNNDQGLAVEGVVEINGTMFSRQERKWNDKNDCVESLKYDADQKLVERLVFDYKYDEKGVIQEVVMKSLNGDGKEHFRQRFEFQYEFHPQNKF